MDLRAFIHIIVFVFLFVFGESKNAFAFPPKNDNPLVPYEIKFADVTFQLNDVTRYLIQTELKSIQANRNNIKSQLNRISLFLPMVEPILKDQNVPDDFKYLVSYDKYQSSIETISSLESGVYWCLDKQKAEDVDLLMNNQLDERKHLIASTKGASICLKRNYVLYKNWGTTLFSHISDKKVLSILEVNRKWSGNGYILLDSPAYSAILQFLAYKIAIEREFPVYKPAVQQIIYEYPYSKGRTLNRISAELKVEPATLYEYNLWLKALNVPDTECQVLVVVPASRYSEIRTLSELSRSVGLPAKDLGFPVLNRTEKYTKSKGGVFYNINTLKGVQAEMCDAVVTMAYKANISISNFVEYNDMKETDVLHIGRVYYIEKKNAKASVPFHVVREGESLWDVSQMYGVRLENLLGFNRLEAVQRLQRGRIVWLQKTRPKNKPIEYIELPDEFAVIEDRLSAESVEERFAPIQIKDLLEKVENTKVIIKDEKSIPNKIDLNSLPLSQEIGQTKNTVIVTPKNDVPKEIDLNSLPLSQEIRKEESKNLNLPKDVNNKAIIVEKVESKLDSKYKYHTVRKDETLFRISVNYNVSVENLWRMNNLSSTIVERGTVLRVKLL